MRRLGIGAKIWLSIAVFVLGYAISVGLGQFQGHATESRLADAAEALFPAAIRSQEAQTAFQRMTRSFSDAVMTQDAAALERAAKESAESIEALRSIASLQGLPEGRTSEAARVAGVVEKLARQAQATYGGMISAAGNVSEQMQQDVRRLAGETDSAKQQLQVLYEQLSQDLRSALAEMGASSARQRWIALAVFFATLLLATAVVTWTIRRSITGPILTAVQGVREAASRAGEASDAMARSGEAVAQSAAEQASHLQQTASSLEEMSATTQQNADRAVRADQLMREAKLTVDKAADTVNQLTSAMTEIAQATSKVSGVLKSIDEIAFQTNILALNAAVEAARAGAAGSGFSVVADEVRALAMRASEAARTSGDLVEHTVSKVRMGVDFVTEARRAFEQISGAVVGGSQVVTQIAAAAGEQSRGITSMGETLTRMESVTQSNAANAQQTASSANQMHSEVQTTRDHADQLAEVLGL